MRYEFSFYFAYYHFKFIILSLVSLIYLPLTREMLILVYQSRDKVTFTFRYENIGLVIKSLN